MELFTALIKDISAQDIKTALVQSQISTAITNERIHRKMTHVEFAGLLGVTPEKLWLYEQGDYNFTILELSNIFAKLDMNYEIVITKGNGVAK